MQTSVEDLLRLIGELFVENRLLRAQLDAATTPTPPEDPPDAVP